MILTYADLKRLAGGSNPAQVVVNLKRMNIKFLLRPDGKPVSTIDAVNDAMKLRTQNPSIPDSYQDIEI